LISPTVNAELEPSLEPFSHLQPLEHAAHGRMLNIADLLHVFDNRIDNAKAMIEKRRQLANADVTVLINRGRQHGPPVLAIPLRIVGPAAEK